MYLKQLEIFGFKSFPEKTILKFEPGVTVIVGPNGCGKSNLLDSLKWALGEQSPKSLRGSKMEDVIFSGTEHHDPLNYSEVGLTFCNEDKYLPIDYKEVAVSRKLFRSGESNYFINKNVVRLKDVQTLFLGTGIGESTYSFIEQGKIEIFLSYKPEDKRLIFDEASGIIKYKERRKEALKQLEDTEDNLLRLEDILSEVRRQIQYLERQVSKAKRYKEINERLIEVEKKIAAKKFFDLEEKNNKIIEEETGLKEKEASKVSSLLQLKERWDTLEKCLKEVRISLSQASSSAAALSTQIEGSQNQADIYEQRIKELGERNSVLVQSKKDLTARMDLVVTRMAAEAGRLKVVEESLCGLFSEIAELEKERESLKHKIDSARKRSAEEKIKILELEAGKVNLANQRIELQTNLSSAVKRKQRLFLDKVRLENILNEKKEALQNNQKELEEIEVQLNLLREKRGSLASREKELAVSKEALAENLIEKEKELVELNSCYEFLKDLRTKYDTFSMKKKITVVFEEEPKDINKMVISLKDVVFRKEGSLYKTELEAKVIALEESQLEEKIEFTRKELSQVKTDIEELKIKSEKVKEEVSVENKSIEEQERNRQNKLQEKDSLNNEWSRLQEEIDLTEEEIKTNLEEINGLQNSQKEIEAKISGYEDDLSRVRHSLSECQNLIGEGTERTKVIDIDTARKEEQRQSFGREKEALSSKISLFEEEKNNFSKDLENVDKETQSNNQRAVSFREEIDKLNLKMAEDKAKIAGYVQRKEELEKEEAVFSRDLEHEKESAVAGEKEIEELKSAIYNKKLDMQSLEYEKEKIIDYLRQVYHLEFRAEEIDTAAITESCDVLLEEKEKIKKKISSLGEVNLIAIEEFEELKKREEFLDKQKLDLVVAKDDLKKAIQKINRTSKELFLETFYKIQEEFKKNFKFLFGGGRAQLILLDQENILESGVEIEVQPPGKKLQNVSLLSGGEKALTAISLVFAIFRVRPSPICVLDEIDAPLDEANVDRFNNLLREFSSISQFIVITHNKKTMSNADILYGVTMQEKGVSKVVSVKFAVQEKVPA